VTKKIASCLGPLLLRRQTLELYHIQSRAASDAMAGPSSSLSSSCSSSSPSSSPSSSRQKRDVVLHRTARTVLLLLSLSIASTTLYQICQVRIPAIRQQQQQRQQPQHLQQQQQQQYEVESGNNMTCFRGQWLVCKCRTAVFFILLYWNCNRR
jgi:hypothetical protein